jgi:hypothetical protein
VLDPLVDAEDGSLPMGATAEWIWVAGSSRPIAAEATMAEKVLFLRLISGKPRRNATLT